MTWDFHNKVMSYTLYLLFAVFIPEYSCEPAGFVYIGATRGQYLDKTNELNVLACVRKCLEKTAQILGCKASSFNDNGNTCRLLLTMNSSSSAEDKQNHVTWQTYKMTQCVNGWLHWKHACYKMTTEIANWTDARQQCRDMGAHLSTIGDAEEAAFVWEKMVLVQASERVYLGGRDIEKETAWRWEDGDDDVWNDELFSLDNSINDWAVGEPNSIGEEDCLVMEREGTWNDARCSTELPFICEYDL